MGEKLLDRAEGDVLVATDGDRLRVPPPLVVEPWRGLSRWNIYDGNIDGTSGGGNGVIVVRGEDWERVTAKVNATRRIAGEL